MDFVGREMNKKGNEIVGEIDAKLRLEHPLLLCYFAISSFEGFGFNWRLRVIKGSGHSAITEMIHSTLSDLISQMKLFVVAEFP